MKNALLEMNLAVVLWGFTGVLGRAITLDAPVLVFYRMLLTALFMAIIILVRKQWTSVAKQDLRQLFLIGFLMALHWVAFYGAIKLANASIALICLATSSIFTSLLDALIHKTKFNPKELFIGALALMGVFLIYIIPKFYHADNPVIDILPHRNLGILSGVIAALLASLFTVLNKRIAHKYPARQMVFYEMSSGWLFVTLCLPIYFYFNSSADFLPQQDNLLTLFTPNMHHDWIWLVILSLCCTVWAQSLALNALRKISSFTATLSVNLEPVYGILLAFLFFHENNELNWGFFAGMALIMLSVLLQVASVLKNKKHSPGFVEERGGID